MIWNESIDQTIAHVGVLHDGLTRKAANNPPCFFHLVSVMLIASEFTDDQDILKACLLHDTVEDTPYTFDELKEDYGQRIFELVQAVTEPELPEGSLWEDRHEGYRQNLLQGPVEACYISAADKIHNFSNFKHIPNYSAHATKERIETRIQVYGNLVDTISDRLDSPITLMLQKEFERYKSYLRSLV